MPSKLSITLLTLAVLFETVLLPSPIEAAQPPVRYGRGFYRMEDQITGNDTLPHFYIRPVVVYHRKKDMRRYWKLVRAVKRVYPLAQIAKAKMREMEGELDKLPTRKEQRQYIRGVYHDIKEEYTPVLKHMTRTQGKVLLKLIDRETDYTAYEVLREFRGGFIAGFWQTVSRIFGQNLKSEYDKEGRDKMLEQIIIYYEKGLL